MEQRVQPARGSRPKIGIVLQVVEVVVAILGLSATVVFAVCDDRGVSHGKQLNVAGTGRPSTGNATSCS